MSLIINGLPVQTLLPLEASEYLPVRTAPQVKTRYGFDRLIANGVHSDMTLVATGAGQTVNQTAGSLVLTAGTTARSETIIRSVASWKDAFTLRYAMTLSQRIANNNFFIELVDLIGDALAYTINSATSITVTVPAGTIDNAQFVGQTVTIGNYSGTGTFLSGQAVIASVAGQAVTFTVAGFAAGTGTCSIFGWNYHRILYDGTTAASALFGTQRAGYPTTNITATINTTASPGHIGIVNAEDAISTYLDQLSASGTTLRTTVRAQNERNVPEATTPLYLQIRSLNGSSVPASGTTCTIGFVDIENYVTQQVSLTSVRSQSLNSALPAQILNIPAVTQSGTWNVTTVTTVTTLANGQTAHSAASTGSPFRIGGRVKTTNDTNLVSGDASDIATTTDQAAVVKPYAVPELEWSYSAAAAGIVNTSTGVTIKTAAAAGIRNYLESMQIQAESLGAATELVVRDGAGGTVLWRTKIPTAGLPLTQIDFPNPLRGTAATLLEIVTLTPTVTGGVYVNAQGYVAP